MNDENELLEGYTPLILLGENDEGQIGVKIFRDVSLEEFSQLFVYLMKSAIGSIEDAFKHESAEMKLLEMIQADLIEDETISYTESDD